MTAPVLEMPPPAARRPVHPAYWAMLQGLVARICEKGPNPYAADDPLHLCWAAGWNRREPGVPREAVAPGRGRGALGPRREWTALEIACLRLMDGAFSAPAIAAVVGHSPQAVRNKLHRLRPGRAT